MRTLGEPRDQLVIVYPLPAAVSVDAEVMGAVVMTGVAKRDVGIHLPRLTDRPEPLLLQPQVLDSLVTEAVYSDGPADHGPASPWGFATAWGSRADGRDLAISQIVFTFEVGTDDEDFGLLGEIRRAIPAWFSQVKDWVEVLTLQDLDYTAPRRRVYVEGQGWQAWRRSQPISVRGHVHLDFDRGTPLSSSDWQEVTALVKSEAQPPLTATLLRDARAAMARGQHRRAVVDASTALEIALHQVLVARHELAPSELSGELIRRAERWTLGALRETLGRLDGLPQLVTQEVVELRNAVVHKTAKKPTALESAMVIAAAEAACQAASPVWPRLA